MNILAIEDSESVRKMLRVNWLEPILSNIDGATLYTAESLHAGLIFLRKIKPDIIILDLNLPDSQGMDTIKAVHQAAPETPTLIVSGFVDGEIEREASTRQMGVLSKALPLSAGLFLKSIGELFGAKSNIDKADEAIKRAKHFSERITALQNGQRSV